MDCRIEYAASSHIGVHARVGEIRNFSLLTAMSNNETILTAESTGIKDVGKLAALRCTTIRNDHFLSEKGFFNV